MECRSWNNIDHSHDDDIKWKHFTRNWPFFHRSRWSPRTKASDAELRCFLWSALNKRLSKQPWGWLFETPSWSLLRQCNGCGIIDDLAQITDLGQMLTFECTAFGSEPGSGARPPAAPMMWSLLQPCPDPRGTWPPVAPMAMFNSIKLSPGLSQTPAVWMNGPWQRARPAPGHRLLNWWRIMWHIIRVTAIKHRVLHDETFSALLAICTGNSPVAGKFTAQRPVTRSFGVFFDMCWING